MRGYRAADLRLCFRIYAKSRFSHGAAHFPLFSRVESIYDVNQMRDLFKQGRFARCRSRFVVPVMLYEGKV